MKRIAIIGGGISGLAAAFALEQQRQHGVPVDYVVFESSPRLGGVLLTERIEGCVVEAGPDSFLTEKSWATDFCRQLGLGNQLIASKDGERKTYILNKGRLAPIPDGLMFMVPTKLAPVLLSPLFSAGTKLRLAREWFHPPERREVDESIAALVERHYGAEMVDRLVDPLLSGVYGGQASELSVRAVLPRFAEMEAKFGSLGRGLLEGKKKSSGRASSSLFTSLKDGMQEIVDGLIAHLSPAAVCTSTPVEVIRRQDSGWLVSAGYGTDHFDGVIVATPAPTAAKLLQAESAVLAAELAAISYSSSVTIGLGYGSEVRSSLPPGFGFLVPRSEGKRLLAVTFVHNKFPNRTPEDRALIRCFLGGTSDPEVVALTEEQILLTVRKELGEILRINSEPLFSRIYKWEGAMAQYSVGHLDRMARVEAQLARLPGLALSGNAYRGIGVPDCIRSGQEGAAKVLASVALSQVAS